MSTSPPPHWRLPEGVNHALWEYTHTPWLAESEDNYFLGHPLFRADEDAVMSRFHERGPLVDLGCGVGRMALAFARRGFPVVAVELSQAMLEKVETKAQTEGLCVNLIRANLCHLECLPDDHFAYALSMFSTLGMIRGAPARRQALSESARILRPGGRLALHAHNLWLNLRDWQSRGWLVTHLIKTLLGHEDAGDRRMLYRGIPNMEVHLYRWRELKRDLRQAGFAIEEVLPIDTVHARLIPFPRLVHSLRAGGWIVFARKREERQI